MTTLLNIYDGKTSSGAWIVDMEQRAAVALLDGLRTDILSTRPSWWRQLLGQYKKPVVQGVYFYGDVGRGKTAVMDLFFENLPIPKKRRVHFHAFMLEVHDFLFSLRKSRSENKITTGLDDDLMAVADYIADGADVLCFDEFQVKDVADAMILGRLFTALFDRGVFVIMTSNIEPDDLYKDGLQRDRFIPFIKLLKQRLKMFPFTGDIDYRLNLLVDADHYLLSSNDATQKLNDLFIQLSGGHAGKPRDIVVKGRVIHVPRAFKEICYFDFDGLCVAERSAVDYLTLVDHFSIFIVSNIPKMDDSVRNTVLRFVTFVDTLYDHKKHLVLSAETVAEDLYTGDEFKDVFSRTISRLNEMQSKQYVSLSVNRDTQAKVGT